MADGLTNEGSGYYSGWRLLTATRRLHARRASSYGNVIESHCCLRHRPRAELGAAAAQSADRPARTGSAGGALTEDRARHRRHEDAAQQPDGGETFALEPVLTLSLDAPPAAAAAFDSAQRLRAAAQRPPRRHRPRRGTIRWQHRYGVERSRLPSATTWSVVAGDELLAALRRRRPARQSGACPVTGGLRRPASARQRLGGRRGDRRRRAHAPCGRRPGVVDEDRSASSARARPFIAGDGVYLSLDDSRIVALRPGDRANRVGAHAAREARRAAGARRPAVRRRRRQVLLLPRIRSTGSSAGVGGRRQARRRVPRSTRSASTTSALDNILWALDRKAAR